MRIACSPWLLTAEKALGAEHFSRWTLLGVYVTSPLPPLGPPVQKRLSRTRCGRHDGRYPERRYGCGEILRSSRSGRFQRIPRRRFRVAIVRLLLRPQRVDRLRYAQACRWVGSVSIPCLRSPRAPPFTELPSPRFFFYQCLP